MLFSISRLLAHKSGKARPRLPRRRLGFENLESRRVLNATWADTVGEGEVADSSSLPDFELTDVNPNSSSSSSSVSPRDYLGQVSVWYFTFFT